MSVADSTQHFEKGDIIFQTNAPATHIYVLEKGELGVKYGDNPLVEVGSILEGESFGESALLIGGKRSATIGCETDVSVQSFDADQIKGIFKKWVDGKLMCQCLLIEMINSNEMRRAHILEKDREEPRSPVLTDLVNNAISSITTLAETVRQPDDLHKGWDDNNAFLVTGGHALIRNGDNLIEIGTDTCLGASQLLLGNRPTESIMVESITHPLSGWFIPITKQYERLEDLNTGLAAVARGIAHKTVRSAAIS
ncbi:MAG TPA: hypothetical protein DIC49_00680 [Gammaproteobacteria bacterium]|nr:hypothetical protein [Gammaproteobacteria bacterium]